MPMHAWADHVVHVELTSSDAQVAALTARVLRERLPVEPDDVGDVGDVLGTLEVRSTLERPVTAEQVAGALRAAGVRASRVYERAEWSVVDV